MIPGGTILNIERGQWHSLKCLESGTVLLEAKDGEWEKMREEDVLDVRGITQDELWLDKY